MIYSVIEILSEILVHPISNHEFSSILLTLMPLVIFFEIPWTLFILVGIVRYKWERMHEGVRRDYFPSVSCIITCYSEGAAIKQTIRSLTEQIYPGKIQLIVLVDGAAANQETLRVAQSMSGYVNEFLNRKLLVIPKWQRGGVVSSSNAGLRFADGEIIIKVDGDSSMDNNMVERATRHFENPEVVAVSGCLRVRNANESIWTSFQAIEYFIAIQSSKSALSTFNMVNNISGAFGIFRRELLDLVMGWDAGTAEDLDMTMRIKNYFANKKKKFRIVFDPEAMCFTDVPVTLKNYLKQRLRWDGDYSFILAKHKHTLSPKFIGWPNFIGLLVRMFTNLVIPCTVFFYTIWLCIAYPWSFAIALMIFMYLFYFIMHSCMYLFSVLLLSERIGEDLARIPYLLFIPAFMFIGRINALVANLWQWFGKGHQDTSMAPWWVIKKNKF
ncbi:glycosyltransferase family 2 protein [Anaerosinus sp.]|uniref:glycosyltransferase family 2 protein n=1 Tax=Selenobaculum sp. TaxID=3074374 RepID=UPI0015AA2CB9